MSESHFLLLSLLAVLALCVVSGLLICIIFRLQKKVRQQDSIVAELEREYIQAVERLGLLQQQIESEHSSFEREREEIRRAGKELAEAQDARIRELAEELQTVRDNLTMATQKCHEAESALASTEAENREKMQAAEEKIALLEASEKRLILQFENLANRIFEEKHQQFSQISRERLVAILDPVSRKLKDFQERVEYIYDSENRDRISLRAEIARLKELNERIDQDAIHLTNALKGSSKVQGNWGEMQLEMLLENSGLVHGREYDRQVSLTGMDGRRFQPDIIIHLPGKRDVVIDAKVSLTDYERFCSSDDKKARLNHAKAHVASLRRHMKGLSEKRYDELEGINSLDMVIMFIPLEPALHLGMEYEPGLFTEAFRMGILLAGPSTLMATLNIIHNIWQLEYQNRNALHIATEAGKLHDQVANLVDAIEETGRHLERAVKSWETTRKRLCTGRGNLLRRAENIKKLGAKTKKEIKRMVDEPVH